MSAADTALPAKAVSVSTPSGAASTPGGAHGGAQRVGLGSLGSSPTSSQRFAAALKNNLAETHRACRAIQVECRYLIKDLEVELKQEMVDLSQEYDTKLKLAVSVRPNSGSSAGSRSDSNSELSLSSPGLSASELTAVEANKGTRHILQMFDGRVNALREEVMADMKAMERKFDAALRSQQEHMRQTRVLVEAMESSLSNQVESIVEDTQNAFVSAFQKYTALEKMVTQLLAKQEIFESKLEALDAGSTTEGTNSSKSNALRAVAMLTKKVKEKRPKVSKDLEGLVTTAENSSVKLPAKSKSSSANALRAVAMLKKKMKKKKRKATLRVSENSEYALSDTSDASEASSTSLTSVSSDASNTKKKMKGRRYKSRDADKDVQIPKGSLGQHVLMSVKPYAKRPALVEASDTEVQITYRTMVNQVQSCAIALTYCGIKPKSLILLSLPSTPHIPIVCLAASLIDATCIPVSPHLKLTELKKISSEVGGADVLFTSSSALKGHSDLIGKKKDGGFGIVVHVPMKGEDRVDTSAKKSTSSQNVGNVQHHSYSEFLALGRAKKKEVSPPPKVKGAKSIALFAHSQRCRPQGDRLVGLTHKAIISTLVGLEGRTTDNSADITTATGEFGPNDVVAVALPFWDVRALCGVVLPALAAGACVVCPGAELNLSDPSTTLMVMTNHASDEDGGVCINKMWLRRRNLRFIARHHGPGSSAPLTRMFPGLKGLYTPDAEATVILEACTKALAAGCIVCAAGGVVEMGGRVVSNLNSDVPAMQYPTRVLPLISGVECKILNPDSRKLCAPGKRGVVLLKGPSMLAGKDYRNAERGDSNMWASVAKGFVDTKMIGYVVVDDTLGDMLCLEGPMSRAFRLGKIFVPAYQLEAIMLCLKGIEEVCCVPGEKSGNIRALVVKNPDVSEEIAAPTAMLDALLEEEVIPEHHRFAWRGDASKSKLDKATSKAFHKAVLSGMIEIEIVESLPDDGLSF